MFISSDTLYSCKWRLRVEGLGYRVYYSHTWRRASSLQESVARTPSWGTWNPSNPSATWCHCPWRSCPGRNAWPGWHPQGHEPAGTWFHRLRRRARCSRWDRTPRCPLGTPAWRPGRSSGCDPPEFRPGAGSRTVLSCWCPRATPTCSEDWG